MKQVYFSLILNPFLAFAAAVRPADGFIAAVSQMEEAVASQSSGASVVLAAAVQRAEPTAVLKMKKTTTTKRRTNTKKRTTTTSMRKTKSDKISRTSAKLKSTTTSRKSVSSRQSRIFATSASTRHDGSSPAGGAITSDAPSSTSNPIRNSGASSVTSSTTQVPIPSDHSASRSSFASALTSPIDTHSTTTVVSSSTGSDSSAFSTNSLLHSGGNDNSQFGTSLSVTATRNDDAHAPTSVMTSLTASTSSLPPNMSSFMAQSPSKQATSAISQSVTRSTLTTTIQVVTSTTTTATISYGPPPPTFTPAALPAGFEAYVNTSSYDSAHFRVYNVSASNAAQTVQHLEGVYQCFVNDLGWKTTGLVNTDYRELGPYYKTNVFGYDPLPGALGLFFGDSKSGLGQVVVLPDYANSTGVVSHEYGHALTYTNWNWWNQSNTFGWAETIAQFVDDTYGTSPICANGRKSTNDSSTYTLYQPQVLVSYSYFTLANATRNGWGFEYFAWPFLTYIHYNPDQYPRLGSTILRDMFRGYKTNSNETPFHTLQRIANPDTTLSQIVTRYWARVAFADFGHPLAQYQFNYTRNYNPTTLDYNNLDATGSGTWQVKSYKKPAYMGASFVPLKDMQTSVTVSITASAVFQAVVSIMGGGVTRYIDIPQSTTDSLTKATTFAVANGEEAMVVIVNTPDTLLTYDATNVARGPVAQGLDYNISLIGANAALAINGTNTLSATIRYTAAEKKYQGLFSSFPLGGHNAATLGA